jgi:tagatose 1,6-diphosphate aldolase/sulfofructosephosphate aldolase
MNGTSLDAIAGPDGRFAVLAMDQRNTLRRMLDGAGQPSADADLSAFKVDVVRALAPSSTGVLLDADYGVGAVRAAGALPAGVGLLVASEPPVRAQWNGEPRTAIDPERRAAYVMQNHGDALKFLVQWRPGRPRNPGEPDLAAEALAVIGEVVGDCRQAGIPSVIEPLVARLPGEPPLEAPAMAELVIQSATQMARTRPDLLKLEWPGGAEGCRRVTQALGSVPWTLLSAGVAFEEFGERVRVALDNGASGFIAGRAIWGEAVTLLGEERVAFLQETAVPRLAALRGLLAEHGRPWREAAA